MGNPVHLGSALLDTLAGTDMQHVIYKETTQLYTGVAKRPRPTRWAPAPRPARCTAPAS